MLVFTRQAVPCERTRAWILYVVHANLVDLFLTRNENFLFLELYTSVAILFVDGLAQS